MTNKIQMIKYREKQPKKRPTLFPFMVYRFMLADKCYRRSFQHGLGYVSIDFSFLFVFWCGKTWWIWDQITETWTQELVMHHKKMVLCNWRLQSYSNLFRITSTNCLNRCSNRLACIDLWWGRVAYLWEANFLWFHCNWHSHHPIWTILETSLLSTTPVPLPPGLLEPNTKWQSRLCPPDRSCLPRKTFYP